MSVRVPITQATIFRFLDGVKPSVDADGIEYSTSNIVDCNLSFGYDQASSTCTLSITSPKDDNGNDVIFKPMDRVVVWQGWDNTENLKITFYGFIDKVTLNNPTKVQILECSDILKLAQNNYYLSVNRGGKLYHSKVVRDQLDIDGNPMGGQSLANRQLEKIIADFLVDSGIPATRHVFPVTNITIGENSPVIFEYESAMDAIQRLYDATGYKVWADPTGYVQLKDIRPIASNNFAFTFQSQVDIYTTSGYWEQERQGNIVSLESSVEDDVRNWIEVQGYDPTASGGNIYATVAGASDYVPTPPTYRKAEVRSDMLETQGQVSATAAKLYNELNRLKYTARATVEGESELRIGQTIKFIDDFVVSSGMCYFLYDYSTRHDDSGYIAELSCVGGTGEGSPASGNISPVASFNAQPVRHEGYYDIVCDASTSYDPNGDNLSYDWTCAGYDPAVGIRTTYTASGVSSITINLEVTDDGSPSLSSSTTRIVSLLPVGVEGGGGSNIKEQALFIAAGTKVYATVNGGNSYTEFELE